MHIKRRPHIRQWLSTRGLLRCLLVWAILAGVLLSTGLPAGRNQVAAESTSESLAAAKEQQEQLAAEQQRLAREMAQLAHAAEQLSGELAWLNQRSDEQRRLYADKTIQLEAAVAEMEAAYMAYIRAEEDLQDKQLQYAERVQVMFAHRHKSIFQIFLESNSLQGFFTTLQFMSIVADTDEQMIEDLEIAKDHAALKQDIAHQYTEEMTAVVNQIEADLAILRADASAREADLSELEVGLSERENAEEALLAESEQLEVQIAALQNQLAAEKAASATAVAQATRSAQATRAAQATPTPRPSAPQSQEPNSRGWVWPYPSDRTVYSPYGMRYHPIYRYYRMHTGVDLGGSYGNPVVSAAGGTVILVNNPREGANTGGSGYGNYIIIDHGDGISTLYAHLKKTLVKVGDTVKAGDKIATCGSTGTSTGPHLHFEVRIFGKHTNPLPYIR